MTLVPYVIFSISGKQSSSVLTLPSIMKSKFGIPRSLVMGRSCILESRHEIASQEGVSMNPSSSNPNLHLANLIIGIKGLTNLGNKQVSLRLSNILDFMLEILDVILEKRPVSLEYNFVKGDILFCTPFSVSSNRITGRGHEYWWRLFCDCREVGGMMGSAKSTAVAKTARGSKNEPARLVEKTDNTVAPLIPPNRPPTSTATMGFYV